MTAHDGQVRSVRSNSDLSLLWTAERQRSIPCYRPDTTLRGGGPAIPSIVRVPFYWEPTEEWTEKVTLWVPKDSNERWLWRPPAQHFNWRHFPCYSSVP